MSLVTLSKLKSVQSRSLKTINVFQKTASDLATINNESEKAVASRSLKIGKLLSKTEKAVVKLEAEQKEFLNLAEKNQKIINKLNEFLGLE